MKTTIRKWYSHYEKEEKWLNAMSAKGQALTSYSWCKYVFENCEQGEYIYRIILLENIPSHPESKAYIEFMQETGVEYISTYGSWVYFRKKATDGPFDIYSDIDSRINHYIRIVRMWGVIGLVNLMMSINNLHSLLISQIDITFPLWISSLNLIVGSILVGACIPYFRKIKRLKKEKLLRE